MTPRERMEAVYAQFPDIGRPTLAARAGVSQNTAQIFLVGKRVSRSSLPPSDAPPAAETQSRSPLDQLSEFEQNLIVKGLQTPTPKPPEKFTWAQDSFKFAGLGDSHIGHAMAHQAWWDKTCSYLERERVDMVLHTGDITEGMSGRDGHVYELEAIGATAQLNLADQRLQQLPVADIMAITGNHDLWGHKTIGFDPGFELAKRCDRFSYLGQNEATIELGPIKIMLSHPGDGSSYATSYASQKFVEALSGGEKPHILLMGHHHKSIFHVCRNVHVFETGTLCAQTGWMRGKKLAAHTGFWVIEVWPNDTGIERIRQEWIPFFS